MDNDGSVKDDKLFFLDDLSLLDVLIENFFCFSLANSVTREIILYYNLVL